MLVLFCITYSIRGPSLHKREEMVLDISSAGLVKVLSKRVGRHRPELRIMDLESWMDGSVRVALRLESFTNTENQTATRDTL